MDTKTLLKTIGGQMTIAKECRITDAAVSQWAKEDVIPEARLQYLRLAHPGPHWAAYESHLEAKTASQAAAGA